MATTFKIVVSGPFGAGKTTFVNAVSDTPVITTETVVSDSSAALKDGTTVAMDYGTIRIAPDASAVADDHAVELLLFGTPGQARFDFMWQILATGADGLLVLVDASRPESVEQAARILRALRAMDAARPFRVGASRLGAHARDDITGLAEAMGVASDAVVPVDVRDRGSAVDLLLALLEAMLLAVDVDDVDSRV